LLQTLIIAINFLIFIKTVIIHQALITSPSVSSFTATSLWLLFI